MRRIDRYIVRTVSSSMLVVMLIVIALDVLFGFIAETNEVKANYQMLQALLYIITTVPRRLYEYLPAGAFMGCLIGLGAIANNSELVVIRAAGVSTARIIWSAVKPAIVVVCFGLILGEYIAPYTESIAQSNKAVAQGAEKNVAGHAGLWHREGNTFMHFNAVQPNGVIHGVSLMTYDKNHWLRSSLFAGRALYQRGQWLMEDIRETMLTPTGATTRRIPGRIWQTELTPQVLSVLVVDPDYLSISGLYTYSRYLLNQDLNADRYLMAFWKKVLRPLTTMMLVLVAISFVFGPLRSVTVGFRVFTGIIIGLVFKYIQDLLGPSSLIYGFNPVVATLIPILIGTAIGAYLLRRAG